MDLWLKIFYGYIDIKAGRLTHGSYSDITNKIHVLFLHYTLS